MTHYDLFVIGAGSGGLAAAKNAAKYGKKVAIAEHSKVGGTCVIRGCVPKKIMSYAAGIAESISDAKGYGFDIQGAEFDFKTFANKRNAEIERLNAIHISLLEKAGVELIMGKASLKDQNTVTVNNTDYTADNIILATGGTPTLPQVTGAEHMITSDGIWDLTKLPQKMTVWGGGYIALEFTSIFAALGVKVDVIIRQEYILRGFDLCIRKHLQEEMTKRGITFHTKRTIKVVEQNKNGQFTTTLDNDEILESDLVFCALGRTSLTDNIGLESANIALNSKGEVVVNEHLHTLYDNVFAIGDMNGRVALTPVAIKHGRMVTNNLYGGTNLSVDDSAASAVFTAPPLGIVGLSEEEAVDKFGAENIQTFSEEFRPMIHVLSQRTERTLMKMVVHKETDVVLGLHMAGRDSPEIIQGFAVAVRAELTKAQFDATVAIHPSSAEEFVLMK
ncbi:MAG: glutathione reductase (NADPH) [Alphaproteobacteria bacterium]|jgi:glutathione reductase (NADPH)